MPKMQGFMHAQARVEQGFILKQTLLIHSGQLHGRSAGRGLAGETQVNCCLASVFMPVEARQEEIRCG